MVANINNFGVINFYENNTHKQEPSKKAEPVCEDITPTEDPSNYSDCQSDVHLFKYIHVAVTDDKEREQIHKMVCNIVRLPKMKQICDELYLLIKKEKILATIKPEAMLAELRRVGMPSADTPGFSDQNFYSNYRA